MSSVQQSFTIVQGPGHVLARFALHDGPSVLDITRHIPFASHALRAYLITETGQKPVRLTVYRQSITCSCHNVNDIGQPCRHKSALRRAGCLSRPASAVKGGA